MSVMSGFAVSRNAAFWLHQIRVLSHQARSPFTRARLSLIPTSSHWSVFCPRIRLCLHSVTYNMPRVTTILHCGLFRVISDTVTHGPLTALSLIHCAMQWFSVNPAACVRRFSQMGCWHWERNLQLCLWYKRTRWEPGPLLKQLFLNSLRSELSVCVKWAWRVISTP